VVLRSLSPPGAFPLVASKKDIDEVIAVCRQATAANRSTAARRGTLIHLAPADADDVLVTADLHGDRTNFRRVLSVADLEKNRRRHLVFQEVIHGGPTYPDAGGCMSHLLLEDVARLKTRFPERVHFLMGNHELAELTDYPVMKGGRMLNLLFRTGVQTLYGAAADDVREAYLGLIRSLPLGLKLADDVLITHSLPEGLDRRPLTKDIFSQEPEDADFQEGGDVFRIVWGRDYREKNAERYCHLTGARFLITGHEPCAAGYRSPNSRQLILDTCSRKSCYAVIALANLPQTLEELLGCVRYLDQN